MIISVPPIIDKETFEAVQAKMRERDPLRNKAVRSPPHPTLLSGLPCCGTCEWTMKGVSGKSSQYRYYKCGKAEKYIDGGCDDPRIIPQGLLDDLVVDHLSDIVFEPNRLRLVLEEAIEAEQADQHELPRQLETLIHRRATLETQISRLYRGVALGRIDPEDRLFADQINVLREERVQVEGRIASLRSVQSEFPPLTAARVRKFSEALRTALHTSEPRVRRAYLRFFLKRVVVYKEQVRLEGHKTLLARAYGREWQDSARAVGGKRAVLPQVDEWWSRGGSNP